MGIWRKVRAREGSPPQVLRRKQLCAVHMGVMVMVPYVPFGQLTIHCFNNFPYLHSHGMQICPCLMHALTNS